MEIAELKMSLSNFMDLEYLGLTVYFRLKLGDIKLADINSDILPELQELFFEKIKSTITENEDMHIMNLSEADNRKNVIYKYDYDEELDLFNEIDSMASIVEANSFNFNENLINDIDGLIIRIANSETSIILYSKCYPINIVKRDRVFKLIPAGTRFDKFDEQIIKINGNFEILKYNSTYYVLNFELLERNYGFEEVIMSRANSSISKIEEIGLVEDLGPLQDNLNTISFARKFAKAARSSPVINLGLPACTIIDFVKNHSRLARKFKFNDAENKVILDTKASCKFFIKLLDDDYLHSQLTGIEYDSSAKDQMTQ